MFFCEKYPVIEKRELADGIYSVVVNAPNAAKAAVAGQFADIGVPGFTLRRPISICGIDKGRGTLRFVFEMRGKGTAELAKISEGDELDILAPLGNGFSIPETGRIIVVGGGIGVPPMLEISAETHERCTAIIGFREKGLVTFPLADELEKGDVAAVMACGPAPMLKSVAKMCDVYNVPCRVSLEQRMGCGVGACVVCSCLTVRNGKEMYSRVCKDGPVFNAEEVKFDG